MAVDAAAAPPSKLRWGELEEDDTEDLDSFFPQKQVIGPDENGIKKVAEYKFNDEGNKVKMTTTTRIRKLAKARLSKRAIERRSWSKFGDAVREEVGSRLTMVSTEEIILERPWAPWNAPILNSMKIYAFSLIAISTDNDFVNLGVQGSFLLCCVYVCMPIENAGTKQEEIPATGDGLSQLSKSAAVLMVCRTCGKKGDHWASRCPYKDLAQPTDGFIDKPSIDTTATGGSTRDGAYVPPNLRAGNLERTSNDMRRRLDDKYTVRVSNLSENTRDPDLEELFRPFGSMVRACVVWDHKTETSRGFGFVDFRNKEDGERAINKLNGYGYDNLILRVEWAARDQTSFTWTRYPN